jgi:hypothetical protein
VVVVYLNNILIFHIGAPQCTERFDSRNGHTVSNDSDSMNT